MSVEMLTGELAQKVMSLENCLLVVRHGQTHWNAEDRLTTSTDISLNLAGEGQALDLSRALAGAQFDYATASPKQRAFNTGQMALSWCESPGISLDKRLVEPAAGFCFEGKTFTELREGQHAEAFAAYQSETDPVYPEGCESVEDAADRAAEVLADAASRPGRHFIATHGAFARIMVCVFLATDPRLYRRIKLDNCHGVLFKHYPSPPHQLYGINLPPV